MGDSDVEAGLGADRGRSSSKGGRGGGPGSDFARLSRSGNSLYELLEIPKTSTDQEIKKKYRRLALRYHPDKNPDNAEAEEMFKKINHANSILSDEKKRKIYDDYGSFGIYITEQMGAESEGALKMMSMLNSIWCNILSLFCFCLSGCCCCCCCLCCCFCCCGKCAPKDVEGEHPDWEDLQDGEEDEVVDKEPLNNRGSSSDLQNGGSATATGGYGSTDDATKERTKTPPGGEDSVTVESEK